MGTRYYRISHLAADIGKDYHDVYVYIHRRQMQLYKLPTTGAALYISREDAERVKAAFADPENFAEEVKKKLA